VTVLFVIAAGGTQVSTVGSFKIKLGQKFAYEHGITFQSDQRMHIHTMARRLFQNSCNTFNG